MFSWIGLSVPDDIFRISLVSVIHYKFPVREGSAIGHHAVVQLLMGSAGWVGTFLARGSPETATRSGQEHVTQAHSYQEHWTLSFGIRTYKIFEIYIKSLNAHIDLNDAPVIEKREFKRKAVGPYCSPEKQFLAINELGKNYNCCNIFVHRYFVFLKVTT